MLVLLATHSDISKNSEFVSQLCFDNSMQGKVAAKNVVAISKALEKIAGDGTLANVLASYPEEIEYLEGLFAIDLYSHNLKINPFIKTTSKIFRSLYGRDGSTFSAAGLEGMTLLVDGLNRCKEPSDRECINGELHSTIDFQGLMGKITIQPNGKSLRPLLVNRIRDGKMEFVLKVH